MWRIMNHTPKVPNWFFSFLCVFLSLAIKMFETMKWKFRVLGPLVNSLTNSQNKTTSKKPSFQLLTQQNLKHWCLLPLLMLATVVPTNNFQMIVLVLAPFAMLLWLVSRFEDFFTIDGNTFLGLWFSYDIDNKVPHVQISIYPIPVLKYFLKHVYLTNPCA